MGYKSMNHKIIKKYMKAFYMKQRVIKDFTRTFEESIQMMDQDPDNYQPETAEISMKFESIDIPDHLVDKFKEVFKNKTILEEKEVMDFLESNR